MATLQDILKKAAGASGGLSPLGPLTTPIVTALTSKKQAQPTATRKTYQPSSTTRQVVSQNNKKANNTVLNAPTAVSNTITPPQGTVTSVTPPASNTTARETVTVYKNGQSREIDKNLVKSFEDAGFSLRPITPAPTMLRGEDTTTPMNDDDIQKSLLKKSLKQQYGDSLTDQELDFLARQQMTTAKTQEDQIAALQSAQEAQLAKLAEIRTGEEARLAARTAEEEAKNKALLQDYRASEEARAAEQRALAERFGTEQQAVSERLLGTRGNLTSTVGTQEIERIQRDTMNTISSINAAKNAAIALKEAELAGASEARLDVLRGQLNDLRSSEQEAILQAETDLQNAKLEALQAGDTARQTMIQSALDRLSIEKASKADAALTKNINDGYIYDEFGQRIADAEGNLLTYETQKDLQDFITLSEGQTLIDPTTGLPIYSSPKTQFQKIGDTTYQVVDGQLVPVQTPANNADTAKAVTQSKQQISLIDEILNDASLNAVVGAKGISTIIPGSPAQAVKNKINQLIGNLVLDERGKLKGSGAISDFETKIIQQSATDLGRNLSNEDFRATLENLKERFSNVEKTAYMSQALGVSQDDAALMLENVKGQTGRYPTIQEIQQQYPAFRNESQTSLNGTDVSGIKDQTRVQNVLGTGVATGIVAGSKFWDKGFDFVLDGGKNADVVTPLSGTVVQSKADGAWGNSVIVQADNGEKIRLSHLGSMNVMSGQRIEAGTIIGKQGNTGKTYGQTGIHVDVTMYDRNGKPYTSQQVASKLFTQKIA